MEQGAATYEAATGRVDVDKTGSRKEDYENAGFNGRLTFGSRPVLLLVDIVKAYIEPASPLYAPPFVIAFKSAVRLTHAAREASVPVIFTNVVYQQQGLDGGVFYRKVPALKHYLRGSPLGEFAAELLPRDDELIVSKQYASAFFATSLSSTLHVMKVDSVMIAGFSTSGCVRASALDALQCGFSPFVVREACGDRDSGPHFANLFDLQAKYAEVIGEREALSLLASKDVDP